jgi:hypothetical protein
MVSTGLSVITTIVLWVTIGLMSLTVIVLVVWAHGVREEMDELIEWVDTHVKAAHDRLDRMGVPGAGPKPADVERIQVSRDGAATTFVPALDDTQIITITDLDRATPAQQADPTVPNWSPRPAPGPPTSPTGTPALWAPALPEAERYGRHARHADT